MLVINKNFLKSLGLLIFSLSLSIFVFITSVNTLVPARDSGAFLYAGQQVLNGSIPYRDIWDHKTPLVYYINAIGIAITPTSLWGIWLIEIVSLFLVFSVIGKILIKKFGFFTGLIGELSLLLLIPKLLVGGNQVEEYGLLFQSLGFLFVLNSIYTGKGSEKNKVINEICLGLLGGLLFLLKPNLIGIVIAYFATLLIFRNRIIDSGKKILIAVASFSIVVGLAVMYLTLNGAFNQFIDQVIIFNSIYARSGIRSIGTVLMYLFTSMYPLSIVFVGLPYYFLKLKKKISSDEFFIVVWVVIEVILCLISKREYNQYFLTIVIPLSLFASYLYKEYDVKFKNISGKLLLFFLVVLVFSVLNVKEISLDFKKFDEHEPFSKQLIFRSYLYNNFQEHQQTLDLIRYNTEPSDKILIWGSEPSLLFLSNRKSVDKYYYQFRLFLPGYDTREERLNELDNDIENTIPKIIIDASTSTVDTEIDKYPQSPPLDINAYRIWLKKTGNVESEQVLRLISFISLKYNVLAPIYGGEWNVYKRK